MEITLAPEEAKFLQRHLKAELAASINSQNDKRLMRQIIKKLG